MDVILNFNSKNYTLKLHELDIWTHSATISAAEMIIFIQDIFTNNPDIKSAVTGVAGGIKNAKAQSI